MRSLFCVKSVLSICTRSATVYCVAKVIPADVPAVNMAAAAWLPQAATSRSAMIHHRLICLLRCLPDPYNFTDWVLCAWFLCYRNISFQQLAKVLWTDNSVLVFDRRSVTLIELQT